MLIVKRRADKRLLFCTIRAVRMIIQATCRLESHMYRVESYMIQCFDCSFSFYSKLCHGLQDSNVNGTVLIMPLYCPVAVATFHIWLTCAYFYYIETDREAFQRDLLLTFQNKLLYY